VKLRLDLVASLAKDPACSELNEDAWAVDKRPTRIAISDGASESYDSRRWAQMLVQKYAENPRFSTEWVADVVHNYGADIDFDALSWSKQMAFDRGSFATLLTLELAENGDEVEVLSLGDSLAVHCRQDEIVCSYPFTAPEQFDERPQLLSTLAVENAFLAEPNFFKNHTSSTWHIQPGDYIYLVTDAVGQWFLREAKSEITALQMLRQVTNEAQFADMVLTLRSQHRIKLDDSTVLRLVVESD
jgi:hypothetical protein